MATPKMKIDMYPQQFQKGKSTVWNWIVERSDPQPQKVKYGTKPEARKTFDSAIFQAHANGYEVHARVVDQTGGGHTGVYKLDGTLVTERIPSTTGDLGPRCEMLPRGSDQKGNGPGGVSASARRKTLAARTTWDNLYDKIKSGAVGICKDGTLVAAKAAKAPKCITADLRDFTYVAARIMMGAKDARFLGSFPGTFALPNDLLGAKAPQQRSSEEVLGRAKTHKDGSPTHSTKPPAAEKPPGRRRRPTAATTPVKPASPAKPTSPAKPVKPASPAKPQVTKPVRPRPPRPPAKPASPAKPQPAQASNRPTVPASPPRPPPKPPSVRPPAPAASSGRLPTAPAAPPAPTASADAREAAAMAQAMRAAMGLA